MGILLLLDGKKKFVMFGRFLKGWAKCLSGQHKKEKKTLLSLIDELDLKGETTPLDDERAKLRKENDDITKLHRDGESKWTQRAKVKHIQEGKTIYTKYFHLIANGKHRKKKYFS
jgi:hypothetical protein